MQDTSHIQDPSDRGFAASKIVLKWEQEICTGGSSRAFETLSRKVEESGAGRVILDMSKCEYLSVAGLRCLMNWNVELTAIGIELKIRGLSPMLELMIRLSRLEWIIEGN